jgi:hypothetical protein
MRLFQFIWPALLALSLAMTSGIAQSQPPSKNAASAVKAPPVRTLPATQAAASNPRLNVVANTAAQSGVIQCLPRINQLTDFIASGAKSGASLFVAPTEPNQRLASVSLEVLAPSALSYVDAYFSPGPANSCSGAYDAVTYWEQPCQDVANKVFPDFKVDNPLRQAISVLNGGTNVRVFLMPAGPGCVSIKKEILF